MNLIVTFRICLFMMFLTMAVMGSQAQQYDGKRADIDRILSNAENFSQAYMALDYDRLALAYTEDAKILPPGTEIIAGRAAIKKRWILPQGVKISYHKTTPTEITIAGKYAYDLGYYEGKTLRQNGTEVAWKGKYLIVWKKVKGDWKIYADAWNRLD